MRVLLRWKWVILAAGLLGFLGFLFLQDLATPPSRDPLARPGASIVLITVEGLRWDFNRFTGLDNLQSLESESISFRAALTPSPQSLPAHASLITGDVPPHHGLRGMVAPPLPAGAVALAEVLEARGYRTGGFISSPFLDRRFGLDQGFDRFDDSRAVGRRRTDCSPGSLGSVTVRAIDWLDENRDGPFFLWLQYRVPPFEGRRLREDPRPEAPSSPGHYASALLLLDEEIGRLFDHLRERGLWDPAIVVLAGVHGEALGELGETGHGLFLNEATVRVPLLVKLSEGRGLPAGDITAPVGLVDVRPTLLDLVAIPDNRSTDGRSLLPLLGGKEMENREVYVESTYPRDQLGGPVLTGLRIGTYFYTEGWRRELQYHPARDEPLEDRMVWDPERERRMQARLGALNEALAAGTVEADPGGELDRDYARILRECGFLEQRGIGPPALTRIMTPARAAELQAWLTRARGLLSRGSLHRAEDVLRQAVALDPENAALLHLLALVRRQRGRGEDAALFLSAALEIDPFRPSLYEDLADILVDSGDPIAAARLLERGAAELPTSVHLRNRRARVLIEIGDEEGARQVWHQVLQLAPGDPRALRGLAGIARRRQDYRLAATRLRSILRRDPGAIGVRLELGEVLLQMAERDARSGAADGGRQAVLEAIGEYRDVLLRDPENRAAERGLERARSRLDDTTDRTG